MSVIQSPSVKSYIFMFLAIIGWGFSTTFVEFGLNYMNPFPFLFFRFLIAMIIITPYAILVKRNEIKKLVSYPMVWLIGLAEMIGLTLQYLGQQHVQAGLSALLAMMFILIVPFLSPIFLKERLTRSNLYGVFVALIGVILISTEGNFNNLKSGSLIGILFLLGAAFAYAFHILFSVKLNQKEGVDTFSLFYIALTIITVTSLLNAVIFDEVTMFPRPALKWLLLLVFFSTIMAFLCYFKAVQEISANATAVLTPLQAVIPLMFDFLFLNVNYSSWIMMGSSLLFVAMLIVVGEPYLHKLTQTKRKLLKNCDDLSVLSVNTSVN